MLLLLWCNKTLNFKLDINSKNNAIETCKILNHADGIFSLKISQLPFDLGLKARYKGTQSQFNMQQFDPVLALQLAGFELTTVLDGLFGFQKSYLSCCFLQT